MTDINNRITLDADQAINSFQKLNKAQKQATASLTNFKVNAEGNIETVFDDLGTKATKAGAAGAKATKRIGDGAKDAAKKTRGLGLSLGDVARIVQSQIIFSALAGIKNGFFEAAEAAKDFQFQVARIEAIEPNFLGSFREEIEKLSVSLGRSLEEVGEATFEALQNDLGDVAKTMQILQGDAQNLALVTGGTLPQAVNALSSIYKSFEGTTENLDNVSGQLFGTINAGRITLKDLENSLGTLAPLGRQAGAGLQDILDAMATITLTGTKASVATTQLRNVFNKLIKPTDSLRKVFNDLGVKGFRELVNEHGGLVDALKAITNEVGNDEQKVAKLFNTIRGNLGVLNTLTNDGKLFAKTALRSAEAADRLGESIKNIQATEAFEATQNAAKLEVIFTAIGDDALVLKNNLTSMFLTVINDAPKAEAALGLVTVGIISATAAVKLFGVSAATAFPPLAAILATAGAVLGTQTFLDRMAKEAGVLNDELAKFQVGSLKEVVKTIEQINADGITKFNEEFSDTSSVFNKVLKDAQETAKGIDKAFRDNEGILDGTADALLEQFGDSRQRILDSIEGAIKDIDKAIAKGKENIENLTGDLEDFTFERGLREMDDAAKLAERMKRATQSVAEAFEKAANVGLSEESQKEARAAADTAVEHAKAALSQADKLGNSILIEKAERKVEEAITAQLQVERQLNRERENVSLKELEKQQQVAKKLNAEQKEQLKTALEARDKLREAAKAGASDEILAGLEDGFNQELEKALKGLDAFAETEIVKAFGFDKAARLGAKQIRQSLEDLKVDWSSSIEGLGKALESEKFEAAVELTALIDGNVVSDTVKRAIALATRGGGSAADNLKNTGQAIQDVAKTQADLANTIESSSAKVKSNVAEAVGLLKEAQQVDNSFEGKLAGKDSVGDAASAKAAGQPLIDALANIGSLGEAELFKLQSGIVAGITEMGKAGTGIFGEIGQAQKDELISGFTAALGAVQAQIETIRAAAKVDDQAIADTENVLDKFLNVTEDENALKVDDSQVEEVNRELTNTKIKANEGALATASIGTAAGSAQPPMNSLVSTTGSLSGAADSAAGAFDRMADAAARAASAAADAISQGADQFASVGGQVMYRASGGGTSGGRGRDTQMVGMEAGEQITNSKSSRQFMPELTAINAGNVPGNMTSGGGDTNISIGDIHVTSTNEVGPTTGREIVRSIERESRRNTVRRRR